MYQKLDNAIPSEPHGMSELVPEVLGHLTETDMTFFDKWSKMNSLETGEARKASKLKSLWCMTPNQREIQGQAISDLTIVSNEENTFKKSSGADFGNAQSIFQIGDMVILSSSKGELALATGTVARISHNSIKLNLEKEILDRNVRFVIDKFEYSQSGGNWLTLAKLMSNSEPAQKLRQIVVAKETATFVPGLPKEVAITGKAILKPLNRVQQKAIFKTMMAEKFVLLKGMPGSGKTTMIVALVRLLVKMGKTVLLTSYTHSAVDNLLIKLLKSENGQACFLRLGRKSKVHTDLVKFSEDYLIESQNINTTQKLDNFFKKQPVIATTCLGANNHSCFQKRKFDYCILDEAGQSLLLSALGPLFHADKFVLVGDPEQLPPVVKSNEAKKLGMDISLFSHLQDQNNTLPLTLQYRMNTEIQEIANFMTYKGELECGNEQVGCKKVELPAEDDIFWPGNLPANCKNLPVAFLDTSELANLAESKGDQGIYNTNEAELVGKLAKLSAKMRVANSHELATIGIIAPFRAQVAVLRKIANLPANDISTVDQFQGRDKDIIIYSCTRTKAKKAKNHEDDIMSDWRRLNVAVTRAKARLWIIGNIEALKTYAPFAKLIEFMSSKELIFQLDK